MRTMLQNVTKALIIVLMVSALAYAQTVTAKGDTCISVKKLQKLESRVDRLKKKVARLEKAVVRTETLRKVEQLKKAALRDSLAGLVRVYFVTCSGDTAKLRNKFGINASRKWAQSRLSLDSLCSVQEMKVYKSDLGAFRKAKKKGLIRVWAVWPKIGKVRKYLNDAKNGFVTKEAINGTIEETKVR